MLKRHHSRRARVCVLALAVVAAGAASAGSAWAQTVSKKTSVTFSGPVEIPGVGLHTLPAGTYVFRLLDSQSDRHILQVLSSDESRVHATVLALPNFRLRATDKTVMTFAERPVGEPPAIKAWFYPGDNWGQELVYPKRRALELAKLTNQPVLYLPDEVAPNIVAPVTTAAEPPVMALRSAPLGAVNPAGEDIALAQVVQPPPVLVAGLPKTAGYLPLVALLGLLSMAVGFSLKPLCDR